jgi:glycosyltransferase involved in cell wall biosynthesis
VPLTCAAGRVLIVVPAFNEEQCLPGTLAELSRCLPGADVVVVDDGSSDGTARSPRTRASRC